MKIIVDARTMGSSPSGVGIYAYNFLKELINKEYSIILLTDISDSKQMKQMEQLGVLVICYGRKVYQSTEVFKYFKFVQAKLYEFQPDLFWEPNAIIPIKIKGYHGKIMITVHDVFPISHGEYFNWKYRMYFKTGIKKTIQQTDSIVYNSLETKQMTEFYLKKAVEKQSLLGYLIIEDKQNSNNSSNHYDNPFFLYVGNMEKRKGVDLLLKAYLQYCNEGGEKALYLAGKMRESDINDLMNKTVKECKKLHYLGYVEEDEVVELYKHCSCFVFPSKAEGLGVPVIEAMEFGKPIIASHLSIFEETVGDCINYFKLGTEAESINQLCLRMKDYSENLDIEQYKRVRMKFSKNQLGEKFREFVNRIVNKE